MNNLSQRRSCQGFLRRWGRLFILIGLILALAGMIEFLCTFGLLQPLRLAWCLMLGMPLLLLGIAATHLPACRSEPPL